MFFRTTIYIVLYSPIFFYLRNYMENPSQQEIPKSYIKGSGAVAIDLSYLHGKGKVLFADPSCFVIGLENLPYRLFATPEFPEESLPITLKNNIYEVKELIFKPTFSTDDSKVVNYCSIPSWLAKFKKVEVLRFEYVELSNLNYLKDLPIHHLIIGKIKYDDSKRLTDIIGQFKNLKEISYDSSISIDLIHSLKRLNLKLTLFNGF